MNELLKDIRNCLSGLQFLTEIKNENPSFASVIFSGVEHVIASVSEVYCLESQIKDSILSERNKNIRIQNEISTLEEKVLTRSDFSNFSNKVKMIFDKILFLWQGIGFQDISDMRMNLNGSIECLLSLHPDTLTENLNKLRLDTITNQYTAEIYALETDLNRRTITDLVEKMYPNSEILKWHSQKSQNQFILSSVAVRVFNLHFLEAPDGK